MIQCISNRCEARSLHLAPCLADASASSPELVDDWRELATDSVDALVELHPQVVLGELAGNSDKPSAYLLRADDSRGRATQLAVLREKRVSLPVLPTLGWRMPLTGLRLIGSRLLGGESAALVTTFRETLERIVGSANSRHACVLFEDVAEDSPWWQALQACRRSRLITLSEPQPRWYLRFPASADEYWQQFSSKTRYNFRRQRRLLEHHWERITNANQVEGFLQAAAAISSQSWQGKRLGLRVSDDRGLVAQFRELADLGALRCYLLRSEGEPVAFAIGTQFNGRYMLEEIGYDTRYAKFSPGTVLLLDMLDDMFQHQPPELLDFGFGDGAYKQLFGNESTRSANLLLVSRRWGASLALRLHRCGALIERTARKLLRFGGMYERLRKRYRR